MNLQTMQRATLLVLVDIALTYVSYLLASLLTDVFDEVFVSTEVVFSLGLLAIINVLVFMFFRLYNSLWEYASIEELIQILIATVLGTLIGAVILWMIDVRLPIRVYVAATIILVLFVGGVRMLYKLWGRRVRKAQRASKAERASFPRTLVVGAGETGALTIRRMAQRDPRMPGIPVVATDDDKKKRGLRIKDVKVEGSTDDIFDLVRKYDIEQIVIAIPSADPEARKRIYDICMCTDCRLRTMPNVRELRTDELDDVTFRDLDVADLLGREEVLLNTRSVSGYIAGEVVLVTGGGGSIGSELCRQLCRVAPKRIVIFDVYENDAYLLRNELLSLYDDIDVVIEIGSVCDERRINEVFDHYQPSVVFHAAAHKHVPLMELCPREALQNNVLGTLNTVRAADRCGVERFTFISTDKAVNPTSIMGATKRLGEMVIQYHAQHSKTIFSAVRFGNVLGSHGSVIPIFQKQINAGGPVTVTDPEIERYFMTIPEASRLVVQASGLAEGGEIFILDMGEPVKIVDLARSLILLSGKTPDVDIKIEYTGLRPGEKMYEELLMAEETTLPTKDSRIMVSAGTDISYNDVADHIEELTAVISESDEAALALIKKLVPSYHPQAEDRGKDGVLVDEAAVDASCSSDAAVLTSSAESSTRASA